MKKKVMIIDDELDTVEMTRILLISKGFEAIGCTKAKDAVYLLEKEGAPDLIILDMKMPEISGPEFCDIIRKDEKFCNVRIVFFTASYVTDQNLLKKYGVLGYILKPFDNNNLITQINKYISM